MTTDELRRLVESKGFAAIHDLREEAGPPPPLRILTVADLERLDRHGQTEYIGTAGAKAMSDRYELSAVQWRHRRRSTCWSMRC